MRSFSKGNRLSAKAGHYLFKGLRRILDGLCEFAMSVFTVNSRHNHFGGALLCSTDRRASSLTATIDLRIYPLRRQLISVLFERRF